MTDLNQATRAKEWLAQAEAKWRLQTLQRRGRYDVKTGKYEKLPIKLRRFLNGTPVGMIGETLRQLEDMAPYRSPVYNWEHDGGLLYRPVNTYIVKDGVANVTNAKDATYTIVQDLRLVEDETDMIGLTDGTSCSQVTTAEYHWDEASVPDCPPAEQGVSWQVASVNRDSETDLFSFVLRKNVAVTQHMPEETVRCTDRSRTTVETWDNLYGERDDWRCDAAVNGSAAVALPEPCGQEAGVTVEISVSENPDCTFKVEVRRTYAAEAEGAAFSVYRDQYRMQGTERTLNSPEPLPKEGTEYANGVTRKYGSERNEDGTWNNTVETETERPVEKSTIEVRVTPRGTVTSRTDTNQAAPAAKVEGLYGSYKVTRTNGGLFTNEYTSYERRKDRVATECTDTAFLHTDEFSDGADAVLAGHVLPASGGIVRSVAYQMGDDGLITRREQVRQEHTVPESRVTVRRTVRGVTTVTETRSASSRGAKPATPGSSVSSEMTDGAMFNVTTEVFEVSAGALVAVQCGDTAFLHVHSESKTAKEAPEGDVEAAAGGIHRERETTFDENGCAVVRETVREEHEVVGSEVTMRMTPRGLVTMTRSRSTSKPDAPDAPGRAATYTLTDGARYDTAVEMFETSEGAMLSTQCERTWLRHEHTAVTASSSPVADADEASPGVTRAVRCTASDQGGYDVQETVTEFVERTIAYASQVTGLRRERTTRYRNAPEPVDAAAIGSASFTINENGTADGEVTELELIPDEKVFVSQVSKLRSERTTSYVNADAPRDASSPLGHASASEDQNGKWSGTVTEVELRPDEGTFASQKTPLREESTTSYVNADAPRDVTADVGRASASEGQDGKWSGQVTNVTLRPDEGTFTAVDNKLVKKTTTAYTNAPAPRDAGSCSDAHASEDQNGKWSGQTSSEDPIPHQEPVGPYTSEETSPYGKGTITITRTWKAIVFVNQEKVPELKAETGKGQATYGVSASYNKYGLLDGKIECTQVVKKWDDGSSSGTPQKNIKSPPYKTVRKIQLAARQDPLTGKVGYWEQEIETTHEIGLRCETLPENMLEGSQVAMTKDKLYNYHAITEIETKEFVFKVKA